MNLNADSSQHANRSHPRPLASDLREKAFCPEVTWQALHPDGAGRAGIRAMAHSESDAGSVGGCRGSFGVGGIFGSRQGIRSPSRPHGRPMVLANCLEF